MKILNNLPVKTDIQEQIGNLSNLKTILKNNLVASINSLYETFLDKTGTADISDTGDGTITGAIKALSMIAQTLDAAASQKVANNDTTTSSGYVADARIVKIHGDEIDALKAENSSINTNSYKTLFIAFNNCYILSSKSPQTLENAKFIASEFALRLSLVLYPFPSCYELS